MVTFDLKRTTNRFVPILAAAMAVFLAISTGPAKAQDGCNYPGFSNARGLNLVGDAAVFGGVLRLTRAEDYQDGAAWCAAKPSVAGGFETAFAFRFSGIGDTGADGIAFVIQNSADNAIGADGYGIGYDGIPNSLAVEFDTWQNYWDPNSNHISVNTGGTGNNSVDHSFSLGITSSVPDMSDGRIHMAKVAYVPGALKVYLDDMTAPILSVAVDLSTELGLDSGRAWAGFTSSTGGAWENHDILLWGFSNSGVCSLLCSGSVPESAAYATPVPFSALTATLYCANGFSYDWDFGDGTPHSATPFATHHFAGTGTYNWLLHITGGGLSCSKGGSINITPTMQGACSEVPPFYPLGRSASGAQAQGALGNYSCDDPIFPGEGIRLGGGPDEGRAWFDFAAGSPGDAISVTLDWQDSAAGQGWKSLDIFDWEKEAWRSFSSWNDLASTAQATASTVCLEPANIGFMGKVRIGAWSSAEAILHVSSLKAAVADVSGLALSSIAPARGGNGGRVSLHAVGAGFIGGASLQLRKGGSPDIFALSTGVDPCGLGLSAQFDLAGAAVGLYDVIVSNPGGSTVSLPGAFTVETYRPPDLWVDVVGRTVLRGGRPQTYYVTFGNSGNQDAYAVPLWIEIPKWISCEVISPVQEPLQDPAYQAVDYSQIPISFQTETETLIPLVIFRIQPGVTGSITLRLTASDDPQYAHAPFELSATLSPPMLDDSDLAGLAEGSSSDALACQFAIIGEALNILGVVFPPADCAASIGAFYMNNYISFVGMVATGQAPNAGSYSQLTAGMVASLVDCGYNLIPGAGQIANAVQVVLGAKDVIDNCSGPLGDLARALRGGEVVTSGDPNEKDGPSGCGEARHFRAAEPLRYAIFFENKKEATAPAQVVTVTDPLDADTMDLSTFALGPIAFGSRTITPPPGLSSWSGDVDLRPDMDLILRIEAGLNRATSSATWSFTSLDPATMQLTEDPLSGFLPPDVTPPEGQGSVTFSLEPKAGLQHGARISNKATIVFDLNAPIDTPAWSNTVDAAPPHSSISHLPAVTRAETFLVSWGGGDDGAGIDSYTISVSENGGPFATWLFSTAETSATFTGSWGHTYSFVSRARDGAGNEEPAHTAPDAFTTLQKPTLPGDCDGEGGVSIGEVQRAINMFLGGVAPGCGADCDGDGGVNIGELQKVINAFLGLPSSC